MTLDVIENTLVPHLATQFERALPVLFTGAGFSVDVGTISNDRVPTYDALRNKLWTLCFPGEPVDPQASLQHLYEHALLRHRRDLTLLLTNAFTVNANTLPNWYQFIFSMPWFRCYTLNVDDVDTAAQRAFKLPRQLVSISATASANQDMPRTEASSGLEVIHLNGKVSDIPDNVTFSVTQYAERLSRHEPWYTQVVSDLLSHPFVFIGTRLDEPPLWQYIQMRKARGARGLRELRPRSYLVTQSLDKARQALLAEFHVEWIPMTAQAFVETVLTRLQNSANTGHLHIRSLTDRSKATPPTIPEVSSLARNPNLKSDYLLGQEPIWADIQSGRAIARESDEHIWNIIKQSLTKTGQKNAIVIVGTAGAGKSTALMRACLRLVAEGFRVAWVDRESDVSPREIRSAMRQDNAPSLLAIDDADVYGSELAPSLKEIADYHSHPLILIAVRSGKIERVLNPNLMKGINIDEHVIPPLSDSDIDGLIDALDRENRLGILKGKPRIEQRKLFAVQSGRQLLVAMIQATSGRKFEDKVMDELMELDEDSRRVYSLIAVASALRFGLSKDEILIASGDQSNKTLNLIEQMQRRHIIRASPDGDIHARHRVIAEILLRQLQLRQDLTDVLSGLILVAATKANPRGPKSGRPWRLLKMLLNHEFLSRTVGLEPSRNIYGEFEDVLSWDYHYWLQRGSLEVKFGDLSLAENFLNQAKGLAGDDPLVDNELAYLLFKKGLMNPAGVESQGYVEEATHILEELIYKRGHFDPYPYHVLGSQGLAWSRKTLRDREGKETYLKYLLSHLEGGIKKHPTNKELAELHRDVKTELLKLAVTSNQQ